MSNSANEAILNSMGVKGGEVATTGATTGNFCCILAMTDIVITSVVGNISGISALTVNAGGFIPGTFTTVTLASGTAILFNK
jgi:hypothetical protein